jgi:hypothetical protein
MTDEENIGLEDAFDDTDFGIIISPEGDLKGLFIPAGMEDELVPEVIVNILEQYWGITLDESVTIH